MFLSSGESRGIPAESCLVSLLWRVARHASGEAVTSQSISHRQSTLATPYPVVPTDPLQSFVKPISNKTLLRFALPRRKFAIIRECMLLHAIR